MWSVLGSSQRANGLARYRSRGNPNRHARDNSGSVFPVSWVRAKWRISKLVVSKQSLSSVVGRRYLREVRR
jgi:hypothetical protein